MEHPSHSVFVAGDADGNDDDSCVPNSDAQARADVNANAKNTNVKKMNVKTANANDDDANRSEDVSDPEEYDSDFGNFDRCALTRVNGTTLMRFRARIGIMCTYRQCYCQH